jgi:hypothetical protein
MHLAFPNFSFNSMAMFKVECWSGEGGHIGCLWGSTWQFLLNFFEIFGLVVLDFSKIHGDKRRFKFPAKKDKIARMTIATNNWKQWKTGGFSIQNFITRQYVPTFPTVLYLKINGLFRMKWLLFGSFTFIEFLEKRTKLWIIKM